MAKFRRQPSHRRQPSPAARWLVLGPTEARLVAHGQRSVHVAPVKPSDHFKRYVSGQRLQVRAFVGGPTEARIVVTAAERIQLGDVDFLLARALGHVRLDDFRAAWVAERDPAHDGEPLQRFEHRHAHRDIWVIRFDLDRLTPPRLLAENGREGGSYRRLANGRWQYVGRAEDAEADRGYTSVPSRATRDEPAALSDAEWAQHVDGNRDLSHEQWLALDRATRLGEKRRRPPKHQRKAA